MTPWMSSRCLSLLSIDWAREWLVVSGTAFAFHSSRLGVEGQQTCKNIVSDGIGPAVASRLLPAAPTLLVDLVVKQEIAVVRYVVPAVDVEDSTVHPRM